MPRGKASMMPNRGRPVIRMRDMRTPRSATLPILLNHRNAS